MWLTLCACVVHGTPLHHRYVALRHGQSEANVQGIISSEPSVAVVQHGLSASGRAQAQKAGVALGISIAELKRPALSIRLARVAEAARRCGRACSAAAAVHLPPRATGARHLGAHQEHRPSPLAGRRPARGKSTTSCSG